MSMFTGLKAVNHFGRPDMSSFLKFVQKKHSYVSLIMLLPLVVPQRDWSVQRGMFLQCTDTNRHCPVVKLDTSLLMFTLSLPAQIMSFLCVVHITEVFLYDDIPVCVVLGYYICDTFDLSSYLNNVFRSLNNLYI
jgi:hypothetical protein